MSPYAPSDQVSQAYGPKFGGPMSFVRTRSESFELFEASWGGREGARRTGESLGQAPDQRRSNRFWQSRCQVIRATCRRQLGRGAQHNPLKRPRGGRRTA